LIELVGLGQLALVVQTGSDLKRLLDVTEELHIVPRNMFRDRFGRARRAVS
jgi:hypothetical protein